MKSEKTIVGGTWMEWKTNSGTEQNLKVEPNQVRARGGTKLSQV